MPPTQIFFTPLSRFHSTRKQCDDHLSASAADILFVLPISVHVKKL